MGCYMYVHAKGARGYLTKNDRIVPDPLIPEIRHFGSVEDVGAEIDRRGWVRSSCAWEGGPTRAYACWDFGRGVS